MNYTESQSFFDVSSIIQLDKPFQARFLCLKDFLKKILTLPLVILLKVCKTFSKFIGVCFGAILLLITLGNLARARTFFSDRIFSLMKDLVDWIFLPFALMGRLFRLILALLIHPRFYFS